jgi:hypothetical protein
VVIMQATDDAPMMRLTRTERLFRSCAPYALGAALYLCFSLIAHPGASSKAASMHGFSGAHKTETQSTESPPWEPAKSIAVKTLVAIRGAIRAKHSPPPASLPLERFTKLFLNSSYSPLNSLADIRSLILISPLQSRAPPHFV